MLYPICPTCGALLSNIQIPFENDIKKLCEKYNVDIEEMSRHLLRDADFNVEKKAIVDKYTDPNRYCCRMRLLGYCKLVDIIASQ